MALTVKELLNIYLEKRETAKQAFDKFGERKTDLDSASRDIQNFLKFLDKIVEFKEDKELKK